MRAVRESVCAGGDDPLRLSGPTELEGEAEQDSSGSGPPQSHLLVRHHQSCRQVDYKHWLFPDEEAGSDPNLLESVCDDDKTPGLLSSLNNKLDSLNVEQFF